MSKCESCNEEQEIRSTVKETFRYKPSKFPKVTKDMTFVDIESRSFLLDTVDQIKESADYDGITSDADIEIALHIDKDGKTPLEILDYMDLKSIKTMMSTLEKISPSMDMYVERACKNANCREKGKFYTDDIPDIFSEILE